MKHLISVEVSTGVITRYMDGAQLDSSINAVITARDVMDCQVKFTAAGTDITEDILPTGAQLLIGLRASPSEGAILAQSTSHEIVAGLAETVLSLNTAEIVALIDTLPSSARSTRVWFEVEVVGPLAAYRHTLAQQLFTLRCEVNMDGDEPPAAAVGAGFNASTNAAGDTTIQLAENVRIHRELTTVSGAGATTRKLILDTANAVPGSTISHRVLLPETAGITLDWRHAADDGAQLTSYVSDGSGDAVVAVFVYGGGAWNFWEFTNPANA